MLISDWSSDVCSSDLFLRQAGVDFARTNVECKSPEQAQEEEARRTAEELARQETRERMTADARRAAMTAARDQAEQEIISGRANHMAVAAILLAFAVLCAGGAAMMSTQDKRRPAIIVGAGGGRLRLGAIGVFFTRPGISSIDDRAAL